ncbi:MAG: rhodanese-like domain-containing protein [Streptosporangiales bacterium]|nr:rhodanese-like domain-containing protein [Streptosporangiales bacterium]MBO0890419.1 rhodanese-like domain-containing protein [Acidothermales bacterium]
MFGDQSVPAVEAAQLPDDAVLLDVREPYEWEAGHAPNAVHVPLGELGGRLADLPKVGADERLYVVCRGGSRSAQAAAALGQAGYPAVNVTGGMTAWALAGKPMASETGNPPEVA